MPIDSVFEGAPAWPGEQNAEPARDPRFDNQPPLEERIVMEFEEQLREDRLTARIGEITESAGRVPEITGQTIAGKVGDLISLARTCRKEVEARRETHNRPLLNAQRALKGRCDALLQPMDDAINAVNRRLDAYMAEEARKAAEARRQAEEQARIAREAAEKAAREATEAGKPTTVEDLLPPIIEPAKVPEPVARGDMGARVGTKTVWRHEIEAPIAKLPKAILENATVREAVDKVIAAAIRAGNREIKGVRIWSEQVADVR